MSMILHTGPPGAGKTYHMVNSFIKMFCKYDKEEQRFRFKKTSDNIVLISNVEGLRIRHFDLETLMSERCLVLAKKKFIDNIGKIKLKDMEEVIDEYYHEFMSEKVRWFFNYDYQKRLQLIYGSVVYLVEECQRYFDSKELGRQKWVRDTLYYFEKHRHLGASIFMDTQHNSKIVKGINVLFESEIKAKPRTLSLAGEMKYNAYSDGMKTNQIPIVVRPDKRVFKEYKSMQANELVKPKKPVLKLAIFVCVVCCSGFFVFDYAKANLGENSTNKKDPVIVSRSIQSYSGSVQKIPVEIPKGRWVRLPHVLSSEGITVIHPQTSSIVPLKEFDLEVKRSGKELLCFIPDVGY